MKTKKVCLEGFKENALERKQIMSISGGGDTDEYYVYNPKTGELEVYSYTSPHGGGNNGSSDAGAGIVNPKP